MQIMMDLLTELYDFALTGTRYELMRSRVTDIDIRGRMILEHLKFNPSNVKLTNLFSIPDDQRNQAAKALAERVQKQPEYAIGEVINVYCDTIQRLVKDDLLAFATDFEAGNRLRFTISFHSFAINFSSTKQSTEDEKIRARLLKFQEDGIQIGRKRNHNILVDCEKNREFLTQYCKTTFGTEPWEIRTHQGEIWSIDMSMDYKNLLPVPKPEEVEPEGDSLTADEARSLLQAIKQCKETLASYQMMAEAGSGDLLLSVFQGHLYDIEKCTHCYGQIYEEREAKYRDIRAMNQETFRINEGIGYTAAAVLQPKLRDMFSKYECKLCALANKDTLYVSEFALGDNCVGSLVLMPHSMVYREPVTELEGEYDKESSMFYIANTEENLKKILTHLTVYLPSLSLVSYEVRPRNGKFVLHTINLSFGNPYELESLNSIPNPDPDEE